MEDTTIKITTKSFQPPRPPTRPATFEDKVIKTRILYRQRKRPATKKERNTEAKKKSFQTRPPTLPKTMEEPTTETNVQSSRLGPPLPETIEELITETNKMSSQQGPPTLSATLNDIKVTTNKPLTLVSHLALKNTTREVTTHHSLPPPNSPTLNTTITTANPRPARNKLNKRQRERLSSKFKIEFCKFYNAHVEYTGRLTDFVLCSEIRDTFRAFCTAQKRLPQLLLDPQLAAYISTQLASFGVRVMPLSRKEGAEYGCLGLRYREGVQPGKAYVPLGVTGRSLCQKPKGASKQQKKEQKQQKEQHQNQEDAGTTQKQAQKDVAAKTEAEDGQRRVSGPRRSLFPAVPSTASPSHTPVHTPLNPLRPPPPLKRLPHHGHHSNHPFAANTSSASCSSKALPPLIPLATFSHSSITSKPSSPPPLIPLPTSKPASENPNHSSVSTTSSSSSPPKTLPNATTPNKPSIPAPITSTSSISPPLKPLPNTTTPNKPSVHFHVAGTSSALETSPKVKLPNPSQSQTASQSLYPLSTQGPYSLPYFSAIPFPQPPIPTSAAQGIHSHSQAPPNDFPPFPTAQNMPSNPTQPSIVISQLPAPFALPPSSLLTAQSMPTNPAQPPTGMSHLPASFFMPPPGPTPTSNPPPFPMAPNMTINPDHPPTGMLQLPASFHMPHPSLPASNMLYFNSYSIPGAAYHSFPFPQQTQPNGDPTNIESTAKLNQNFPYMPQLPTHNPHAAFPQSLQRHSSPTFPFFPTSPTAFFPSPCFPYLSPPHTPYPVHSTGTPNTPPCSPVPLRPTSTVTRHRPIRPKKTPQASKVRPL